ncbi:hypothetical protein CWS35_24645 [Bradyrhizobium sp. SK17]|uniref:hypothetical protein n=1 Tax=Bradyrhizobium sp. SK17 TaxID=2057741 RepID=UPI000C30B33A|nr:hypothetical protein [Bradyrhizobium sp. SK17]AUC97076.1 hypothetical protein CWS35_24645 [Bradyrhizobium sp. SK17]
MSEEGEIVWGASEIARAINRSEPQVYLLLKRGCLPGARKIAGRWAFRPAEFRRALATEAAA